MRHASGAVPQQRQQFCVVKDLANIGWGASWFITGTLVSIYSAATAGVRFGVFPTKMRRLRYATLTPNPFNAVDDTPSF